MNTLKMTLLDTIIIVSSLSLLGMAFSLIKALTISNIERAIGIKPARIIENNISIIGAIHHEISHILLATITGAKLKKNRTYGWMGDTFGEIQIVTRGPRILNQIQLTFTGLAPIICGNISCYLITLAFIKNTNHITAENIIWLMIILTITHHMTSTKQEMLSSIRGIPIVFLALLILLVYMDFQIQIFTQYLLIMLICLGLNLIFALLIKFIALIRNCKI